MQKSVVGESVKDEKGMQSTVEHSRSHHFHARIIGENLIELPVEQLRRIANVKGVDSIGRETQYFSHNTTLHGPLRLYKGKGIGKIFWALVICLAFVFLVIQINILTTYFFSQPTATSVVFVPAEALTLPAVTICNYNPITQKYVEYLNTSESGAGYFTNDLLRYMILAYSGVEDLYLHANNATLERGNEDYEYFQKIFTEYPFNIENFFSRSGFSCDEMLKVCSIGGVELDCCAMSQQVLTDLGQCFVFSLDDVQLNQTQPGIFNGLQLVLDAGVHEAVSIDFGDDGNVMPIFSNNLEDGFRLYVRSQDELAYSYTEGLSVSPSYRAYIALNLEIFHFLTPDQWGNCTKDWPTNSPQRAFRLPYTAQNCASLCQQVYYEEKVNCTPLLYSVGDECNFTVPVWYALSCLLALPFESVFAAKLSTCTPSELHDFMLQVVDRTNNITGPECAENICPTSCVTHDYKSFLTYGYGFSESALDWLTGINSSWTEQRIKENFAMVNIFYRELSYTMNVQVHATSLVDTLSNIGGNMGMFFGASVITVMELVIFASKVAWIVISRRRREYMSRKQQEETDREKRLTKAIDKADSKKRSAKLEHIINGTAKIAQASATITHH